ncbi:hypothetical protein [Sphingomonas phyllosphaerae]|uniref:hypothetical protein n=1 Tax=Sphingomonas phyllosphaerae TaxID=257003 RepID=UPI00241308BE|nr:hypothetical protein [Sphingomonas phyllosphaerae]
MTVRRKWALGIAPSLMIFSAALLPVCAARAQQAPEPTSSHPGFDTIRLYSDGAGPSHLFRLSRDAASTGDVIGIVDPLLSAIRFYDVQDANALAPLLRDRIQPLGACALPVDFRPWRLHASRDAVTIESVPTPGSAGYRVRVADLRTTNLQLARTITSIAGPRLAAAGAIVDTQDWNPSAAFQCGAVSAPARVYSAALERAIRGKSNPNRTIILTNTAAALAPANALIVRTPSDTKTRMISARELEPAGGERYVQTAEGAETADGTISITQRIIAFDVSTGKPKAELRFDPATIKGKLGLKPVAVLSTGEILVMGKQPAAGNTSIFQVFSCGTLVGKTQYRLQVCDRTDNDIAARSNADLAPVSQDAPAVQAFDTADPAPLSGLTAASIFAAVTDAVDLDFYVITKDLPIECRVIAGCPSGHQAPHFVPIRGIRLSPTSFRRAGVPYAQTDSITEWKRLSTLTPAQLGQSLARVKQRAVDLPGNLADKFDGDLGIDCSGLVQLAWHGDGHARLSTDSIKNFESDLLCKRHLPSTDYLQPGDAINLNSSSVHHVMLYGAALKLDGANDDWLMLESSSSCDGVCWSIYDPSFFSGWSMFRAAGRSDVPCPEKMRVASARQLTVRRR